jgi:hypothetical protein
LLLLLLRLLESQHYNGCVSVSLQLQQLLFVCWRGWLQGQLAPTILQLLTPAKPSHTKRRKGGVRLYPQRTRRTADAQEPAAQQYLLL